MYVATTAPVKFDEEESVTTGSDESSTELEHTADSRGSGLKKNKSYLSQCTTVSGSLASESQASAADLFSEKPDVESDVESLVEALEGHH